jgi:hypothetical protein
MEEMSVNLSFAHFLPSFSNCPDMEDDALEGPVELTFMAV